MHVRAIPKDYTRVIHIMVKCKYGCIFWFRFFSTVRYSAEDKNIPGVVLCDQRICPQHNGDSMAGTEHSATLSRQMCTSFISTQRVETYPMS